MSSGNEVASVTIPELTSETIEPKQRIFTYDELLSREVESVPTLFDKIIIAKGLGVVYGPADCGKSMWLRQMCACVATGCSFMGWEYRGIHHKAIYFSSEDDADLTSPVIKRNQKTMQLPEDARKNLRYVFGWDAEELPDLLRDELDREAADLVVIDVFGDAFDGRNTNDTTEIRKFYKTFAHIAEDYGCCIIFNHHASKYSASMPPSKASALGSEAVVSKPRLAIEMRPDYANNTIVHVCITKGNYIPSEEKQKSIAIKMDENLVFHPTGDRVPFGDLVAGKFTQRKTAPKDYPKDTHLNFLRGVLGDKENNQSYLRREIENEFGVSDKTARSFIAYYERQGWLVCSGNKGLSKLYKCAL